MCCVIEEVVQEQETEEGEKDENLKECWRKDRAVSTMNKSIAALNECDCVDVNKKP